MAMYSLKGPSFLTFLLSTTAVVIAIGVSFLVDDVFCVAPSPHSRSWSTSSISSLLIHAAGGRFCRPGSPLDKREGWDLLHYLGGNGPWIEKADARFGTYETAVKPPEGCGIDQVHMLSRHAERYPTTNAGVRHLALLSRLESHRLNGSLSFLNSGNWTYFTPVTSPSFEDLTTTSQYAGTLSAFRLGTQFRTRYAHLLPDPTQPHRPVNFWSASSPRDVETALYFADGLFGRGWSSSQNTTSTGPTARLHIVPELPSQGGNTLTPGVSCLDYHRDGSKGHDLGYLKLAEWQAIFSKPISDRLSAGNPELEPAGFSALEVYSMMELCGFEMLVRGSSPWCQVFSHAEWADFEYARDLLHFYRAGPGNRYAGAMGSLWLDAVARLVIEDSKVGPAGGGGGGIGSPPSPGTGEIYVSFVHDGDIVPVLAALGVFDEDMDDDESGSGSGRPDNGKHHGQDLPTTHVKRDRKWRTSDLVPMAGRLVIERLNCRTPHGRRYRDVRLFVNDGWVGWAAQGPRQSNGKGKGERVFVPQVEVGRFRDMVQKKKESFGGFREVCGLDEAVDEGIRFLHQ